ncbi:MAG: conjugal transfer protein TraG N-terminal domain-containing protein, partial [Gammaproteobacteria bacterium]|nr:conjugal transfer protein TraG N-terminal domain-containing protein [Gammaproteobacteria bacterium]
VNNTQIKDAKTRRELRLFFNDCYFPALGEYLERQDLHNTQIDSRDLNWLGSPYLINQVYPNYRAKQPIYGFDYNPSRDEEWDPANPPIYGMPDCRQWWTGQGHFLGEGLRTQVLNQLDPTIWTWVKSQVAQLKGEPDAAIEDIAIRAMVNKEKPFFSGLSNLEAYTDKGFQGAVTGTAGQVGALLESITFYPKMHMVKAASPIIQAVILMLLVVVLPFILVFSSYKISTVIFMSIVFFAVRFWTVLWAIGHWLDNHLLDALTPQWYWFDTPDTLIADEIIGFVIAMLYIVLPLFWLGALSWVGFRVGSAMNATVDNMRSPASSAGASGGNLAKSTATRGASGLKKK